MYMMIPYYYGICTCLSYSGLPLPVVFISFGAAFDEYGTDEMLVKILLYLICHCMYSTGGNIGKLGKLTAIFANIVYYVKIHQH